MTQFYEVNMRTVDIDICGNKSVILLAESFFNKINKNSAYTIYNLRYNNLFVRIFFRKPN